jgi:hypothetical protein
MKKEKDFITVLIVGTSFLLQILNLTVEQAGHHFQRLCQELLKLKRTTLLGWSALNIIVLIVEPITDMFLMMDQENQVKDFVVMVYV